VYDRSPATNSTPTLLTDSAAVVLVSYGKNGLGAVTVKGTVNVPPDATASPDERTNANVDGTGTAYFRREYTETVGPYGAFDDLVMIVSATDLTTPLMRDGALTSVNGSVNKALSTMTDTVIGTAVVAGPSTTLPAYYPGALPLDPWGRQMVYTRIYSLAITPATTDLGLAYELKSLGPDELNTLDDIVVTMPVQTLKGILVKAGLASS
jgi:hypothetical protein